MTVEELASLVADMRAAQKSFFRQRSNSALEESKRLEKRVDEAVADVLRPEKQRSFLS